MRKPSDKTILIMILAGAFSVRLLWIFMFSPQELVGDCLGYHVNATRLLLEEGSRPVDKVAYVPPLYPLFLAGIYKLFGINPLAVKLIQTMLSTFTCWLMFILGRLLINKRAGLWVAVVCALYPQFIRYAGELWTETLFLFLFTAALIFLFKGINNGRHNLAAAGLLLGAGALTREIAFLFLAPLSVWFFVTLRERERLQNIVLKFGLVAIGLVLVVAPWTFRNYMQFKKFIPISTNGGINFYIGNNPEADGEFKWRIPKGVRWPAFMVGAGADEIKAAELTAHEEGYRQGMQFIKENPGRFVQLAFKKLYFYWAPPYFNLDLCHFSPEMLFRLIWVIFDSVILLFATAGFLISARLKDERWALLGLWLIMVTFIGVMMYYSPRYRLPLAPALILFAALAWDRFLNSHLQLSRAKR